MQLDLTLDRLLSNFSLPTYSQLLFLRALAVERLSLQIPSLSFQYVHLQKNKYLLSSYKTECLSQGPGALF